MSKPEKIEKIEINYGDAPILADLEFIQLVKNYRKVHLEEKKFEGDAKKQKALKEPIGEEIQEALRAAGADIVNMPGIRGKDYKITLVKMDPDTTQTDESKLHDAMMKIGKLDAVTVAKIFAAAQVPAVRKPHILVTVS